MRQRPLNSSVSVHTKVTAVICAIVVALLAAVLAVWPTNQTLHAITWVRPHVLENESILLFDNGTFEARFSFDIGPASKSVGTWRKREDLKTDHVITLEPSAGSPKFVAAYGHLFVRTLKSGEQVLVPGNDVVAFDAGDRFSEYAAFHREVASAAR